MPEKSQSRKITVTSENAKDVMVESMVLRKLEITFGGRDLRAGRMDPASISSVRSDLFRERSKSRREDLAVGSRWLEMAYVSDTIAHHEDRSDPTAMFLTSPRKRPGEAASLLHRKCTYDGTGFPQTT